MVRSRSSGNGGRERKSAGEAGNQESAARPSQGGVRTNNTKGAVQLGGVPTLGGDFPGPSVMAGRAGTFLACRLLVAAGQWQVAGQGEWAPTGRGLAANAGCQKLLQGALLPERGTACQPTPYYSSS